MAYSLSRRRFLLAGLALLAPAVRAEVPPQTDDQLQQTADLIVTGRVIEIVVKEVTSYPEHIRFRPFSRNRYVRADYTITISADRIDKGALAPASKQVIFAAWQAIRTPDGWVGGANTMRVDLHDGDRVKAYLTSERSGGWSLFHWQGLKILPKD